MKTDPIELMLDVILENSPKSKWSSAPLEAFRKVGNTNRGDIGEIFLERYLLTCGIEVERASSRIQEWDLKIRNKKVEIKTASEGNKGTFQFNHVRLDRKYDYLICLGVCPNEIRFNMWSKGEVAEGKAGTLVRMAEGQSITFKITKTVDTLLPIDVLTDFLHARIQ